MGLTVRELDVLRHLHQGHNVPRLATMLHMSELSIARRHLRVVLDNFWDNDWRRRHKGQDESPQDHLGRAATSAFETLDAANQLRR